MPYYPGLRGRSRVVVPPDVRERTAGRLLALKHELAKIPQHSIDQRVLVATWNIREFDSTKGGKRGIEPLLYIAEIISAFDLVAVQEVRDDLAALNKLLGYLGSWWSVLISDVTRGQTGGNSERLAFLYDSRKVRFGGLVGEVVRPDPKGHPSGVFVQQFARTPFLVGFQVGWQKFTICTAHIYYGTGQKDPRRAAEINWLAQYLADQTQEPHAWAQNVLMLGDFNIFEPDEEAAQAIGKAGFHIPPSLTEDHTDLGNIHHYDQIAWLKDPKKPARYPITLSNAGVFRWDDVVYTNGDEAIYRPDMGTFASYREWRTYQMSDHRPMWVELTTDFSTEYLADLAGGGEQPTKEETAPAIQPTQPV